jgi:hypothetical protein
MIIFILRENYILSLRKYNVATRKVSMYYSGSASTSFKLFLKRTSELKKYVILQNSYSYKKRGSDILVFNYKRFC